MGARGRHRAGTVALVITAALTPPVGAASAVPIERVMAVVNEEIITLSELQEESRAAATRLAAGADAPASPPHPAVSERQLLEELITRRLLLQEAAKEKIQVEAAEVGAALEELKTENGLPDDAALEAALRREHLTLPQFRQRLQEQLAIGRLLARKVRGNIIVTEEEVEAHYRRHPLEFTLTPQVQLRHLLIAVPKAGDAGMEAAAVRRATEALAALREGAPFAAVAAHYSDAPTAAQGGQLGVLRRGELAPELEEVAFALRPGQLSTPIRTAAGYNILLVEGKVAPLLPFPQVRDRIREHLFRQQAQQRTQAYLAELRQKATIEIKLP